MSKPREEISNKEYFKDIHFLYEIILSLNSIEEMKLFLKDMLTVSELRMIKRRWHIANLLSEGYDMRTVARKSQTSTQTVSRIKHLLEEGSGGLKQAIKRVGNSNNKRKKTTVGGSKYVKNWVR